MLADADFRNYPARSWCEHQESGVFSARTAVVVSGSRIGEIGRAIWTKHGWRYSGHYGWEPLDSISVRPAKLPESWGLTVYRALYLLTGCADVDSSNLWFIGLCKLAGFEQRPGVALRPTEVAQVASDRLMEAGRVHSCYLGCVGAAVNAVLIGLNDPYLIAEDEHGRWVGRYCPSSPLPPPRAKYACSFRVREHRNYVTYVSHVRVLERIQEPDDLRVSAVTMEER